MLATATSRSLQPRPQCETRPLPTVASRRAQPMEQQQQQAAASCTRLCRARSLTGMYWRVAWTTSCTNGCGGGWVHALACKARGMQLCACMLPTWQCCSSLPSLAACATASQPPAPAPAPAAQFPATACLTLPLPCRPRMQIGWQRGKEGGILLAEPNFLGRDERERLCQLMFEVGGCNPCMAVG